MKKFGKFVLGAVSVAAVIGGAYCVLKNVFKKDSADDDLENFEDDMEDLDDEETEKPESENREYVSIKITSDEEAKEEPETEPEAAAEPEKEIKEEPVQEDVIEEAAPASEEKAE